MTARCRWCERPLRVPSPDGYGPTCRRNLGLSPPRRAITRTAPTAPAAPRDDTTGQLALIPEEITP